MSTADILTKLRIDLNDPSDPDEKYSNDLLELLTNNALDITYGLGIYTINTVPVSNYSEFRLLVLSYVYKHAAMTAAEYFKFDEGTSGDSIDKRKVYDNYIKLSKQYYDDYMEQSGSITVNVTSGVLI